MTLFANAPGYQTSITNMSEGGLIVLSVGSVILGCALLIPVMLAGRARRRTEPASMPPWTGAVQGGVHLGDGRSVAPHRDAPAEAFDEEKAVQVQAARDEGSGTGTGTGSGSGSGEG
jgi:hypothetical protein